MMIGPIEVPTTLVAYFFSQSVWPWLKDLFKTWFGDKGEQPKLPEEATAEMSETDMEKINETKSLIKKHFTDNPAEGLGEMSDTQRVQVASDFVDDLKEAYGLDIDIEVAVMESTSWGVYDYDTKTATFNVACLMVDKDDERFDYLVKEFLDTVVHELRHAVQHKAIETPGFWNISEERRKEWSDNMQHYINPKTDIRAYAKQPVENDAASFASMAIEGMA